MTCFSGRSSSLRLEERVDIPFAPECGGLNCLDLELTNGGFILNSIATSAFTIPSDIVALLKLTFLDTNDITLVTAGSSAGFQLAPNALLFGITLFKLSWQVATAVPEGLQLFPMTFGTGEPAPVPEPTSLALLASGIAALASVRLVAKRGGRQAA